MCGIFGLVLGEGQRFTAARALSTIQTLFRLSETRGREASGIAVAQGDRIDVLKAPLSASAFLRSAEYKTFAAAFTRRWVAGQPVSVLGHARLVTNGLQSMEANNQPIVRDGVVTVHNGIIINDGALWDDHPALSRQAEVDTEVFAALLAHYRTRDGALQAGLARAFGLLQGEATVASLLDDDRRVAVATNTGSLYAARASDGTALALLSEETMVRRLIGDAHGAFAGATVTQLRPGHLALIDPAAPALEPVALSEGTAAARVALVTTAEDDGAAASAAASLAAPAVEPRLAAQRRIESISERHEGQRAAMRRCTCCLMPETMPFITFDAEGVCNYCHNYRPKTLKGRAALEAELDSFRSKDGRPDCLVAFSGGRDSSYGLHLLREEFGMTPLAYTYDWGMVTDIARRNQARICGQLGVEHLWVSADIKAKRRNIRNNVKAWMRKPSLGMIPLFMAGDKQFFWYANKLMEETAIPRMVFCMNDYERTDFKFGFAGVPPKKGGKRYWQMNHLYKARMLGFYGKQYLLNPGYLNRSILDTLFAYASYYLVNQEYLYLFDYIEWDEDELNRTLIDEYKWEIAADTPTTWRIGDGTAAFYNYIYHTVAGFTENDAFRSNQIRAGVIDRATGAERVAVENRTRWGALREYLAIIGIDLDEAIRAVERMPRLYDREAPGAA